MKIRRLLIPLCVIILLLVCGLSFNLAHISAQQSSGNAASFTLDRVLSSPFPSELISSAKGERVAWVFNAQGKRNIWGAEGPNFKGRQLTRNNEDNGIEITSPKFTYDGRWIVFVSGGEENSVGEIPNPTSDPEGAKQEILAVSFDDGRLLHLAEGNSPVVSPVGNRIVYSKDGQIWTVEIAGGSEPHQLFAARGNNSSPAWSPDGRVLAFNSSRNDHSFIGIYDIDQKSIKYIAPSIDRDSDPRWAPDGQRIAFIRRPTRGSLPRPIFRDLPEPWAIMVADIATGKATEVWKSGEKTTDSLPTIVDEDILHWAAEDRLVFSSEMDGRLHLYSIPAQGGNPVLLTPGNCEYEQMTFTPDKREIVYSSNCGEIDKRQLKRVAITGSSDGGNFVSAKDQILWNPVVTGSGNHLVFFKSNDQTPGMPYSIPLQSSLQSANPERSATPIAAEVFPKDFPRLVTPQAVLFKAADGIEIHGQLFLPPRARAGEKLPAVVFMHGGPMRQMMLGWHNMYYYHNAYGFNQYLASRGYAVLSVNYRLGIGYGRSFRVVKDGGGRGAAEYQDILAGANYLRSRSDIDQAKIGLWGGSYGGYLTALGLARNSDLFAAGVDLHGVHDWSVRISGSSWIDYADRDAIKIARESSPIGSVEKWRSPVLLIHGDDDRNVAFSQTVELARRLREQKVYFEQLVFPDEIHDFLLHRHWLEIYKAGADFFDRQLKQKQAAKRLSQLDFLIRGGSVIDGSGSAPRQADVGIANDRIVFIGDAAKEKLDALRTIDAAGLIVAPGFIDPHTHAWDYLAKPEFKSNENYLFQGVTTVMTGNDGSSPFPLAKTLALWERQGIGTNAALFVGHGTVRQLVMGMSDAVPAPEQLEKMKQFVREAMDEGAIGMSTGLYYAPGSYAKTEEVIELAKIVGERGGIYDTHMRDESSYSIGLLGSINETIRIGREARIPVHISHIKALGTDVWGQSAQAIEIINRARSEGIDVTANQYPYTASGTGLAAALVPRWAEAGGNGELRKRIEDQSLRPRLISEMEANLKRRGGPESLLITSAPDKENQAVVGKRLSEIAKQMNRSPVEAALSLIASGRIGVASFNMSENDIENFMRQPWVMTGSDGSSGHPRKYGNYPRKIREYVIKRQIISLPRMIEASSKQVAEKFKIRERGRICDGFFADVIVFDEKTIADRATFEEPEKLASGMRYVIVNGKLAIDDGRYTGALAGRALRGDGGASGVR
jgi:N-acyl-D-aspartate/D-glutamate deacylase/dipeptidyl aminopeptidase/acylaminoacyl peptidase